ncbi:hypothetical protein PR202_gn00643 [Eleusine coracana subsp. coracana]|uniref:Uncharacterized protein n=1 Tax=Eleusine coracana subsp. coracana TaxID=191504 RepID=A0AAV5G4E0_ELECO|nr:hypothetical protein PR202_gn00643 [Eleusine coracana subsp. coracana]
MPPCPACCGAAVPPASSAYRRHATYLNRSKKMRTYHGGLYLLVVLQLAELILEARLLLLPGLNILLLLPCLCHRIRCTSPPRSVSLAPTCHLACSLLLLNHHIHNYQRLLGRGTRRAP